MCWHGTCNNYFTNDNNIIVVNNLNNFIFNKYLYIRRNFNMKTLNRKNISVVLLITLGAIFSVNASAAEKSIESSISEMVLAQGQQVVSDLAVQLQHSITAEINRFSIDFSFDEPITESLAWLSEDPAEQDKDKAANTTTKNKLL